MCREYSFMVQAVDPRKVYASDGKGHEGIERRNGLSPDECREGEWTDNTPESLTVRGKSQRESDALREALLARFPTRKALRGKIRRAQAAIDKLVQKEKAACAKADAACDKADAAWGKADAARAKADAAWVKADAARAKADAACDKADAARDKAYAAYYDACARHRTEYDRRIVK
jgi:hypothetical protein